MKLSIESESLFQSKRRKTQGDKEKNIISMDLKNSHIDLLQNELDNQTSEIDYVFNSHKKRKFQNINNDLFVSKIPKPNKTTVIIYSKYQNYPSNIPRYGY